MQRFGGTVYNSPCFWCCFVLNYVTHYTTEQVKSQRSKRKIVVSPVRLRSGQALWRCGFWLDNSGGGGLDDLEMKIADFVVLLGKDVKKVPGTLNSPYDYFEKSGSSLKPVQDKDE